MRGLYKSGVWLREARARELGTWGLAFLRSYAKLASMAYQRRERRFTLVPKLHFFNHLMVELLEGARDHKWSLNPMVFSVQLQEDYIGKPSRISRRVSPKSTHALRTLERVLSGMFAEFKRVEAKRK